MRLFLGVGALVFVLSSWCLAKTTGGEDWPQWMGAERDGVWKEEGLLTEFPEGGPKVLWRVPVGVGYSGPAVADGRVFVTDLQRPLDAEGKPARATRQGIPGSERVLCLNSSDGKLLWEHAYDCPYTISYPNGPRTTPLVDAERVYALGAMGDLFCLAAADGKVQWQKNVLKDYRWWAARLLPILSAAIWGGKGGCVNEHP